LRGSFHGVKPALKMIERSMKEMKESDLWQVVARHLRKRYRWSTDWWAGSGKPFGNFSAGMGYGQPDVVGVSEQLAKPEIHFVEGKILRPSRQKFNETIGQLKDWRDYANYLWAAFARADWQLATAAQREDWESALRVEGIGLVLVKDSKATISIDSRSNSQVDPEKQRLVLERLGSKAAELPVPIFSLDRHNALAATGAIAWCYDIFVTEAREVASASKKGAPPEDYDPKRPLFCWDGWYDANENRAITADPLGSIAGNGVPGILIWRRYRTWDSLLRIRDGLPGALLYILQDGDNFTVTPYSDVDRRHLKEVRFKELWLFWQVTIEGRTRQGIKRSIQDIWKNI